MPSAYADPMTFVVNSTGDNTGACDIENCTLREAITEANANPGVDTINFDVGTVGSSVLIRPTTVLPATSEGVLIDGFSQGGGGYSGPPLVQLDGTDLPNTGAAEYGLSLGPGTTVRGLIITAFPDYGITASHPTPSTIVGNIIGTDTTGASELGNDIGILAGGSVVIGGTTAADRNVISGNIVGVYTSGGAPLVQGNYIGTTPSGMAARPNMQGIFMDGGGYGPGGVAVTGNVISGNSSWGIRIQDGAHTIKDNLIGLASDGVSDLGNGGEGIIVESLNAGGSVIGGVGPTDPNTIAYNGTGVDVEGGVGTSIRGNSIRSNDGLGIDLGPGGVTANDPPANLDDDTGPNNLQNFPVITSATSSSVDGELDSLPEQQFTVDFYASPTCDASDHGEGATHLGSFLVGTDVDGHGVFSNVDLNPDASGTVTATATDESGNTSEFSECFDLGGGGDSPQPGPIYTVNSNSDSQPFSTVGCTTTECTLHEAIEASNGTPLVDDTIRFDLADGHVAVTSGGLPDITDTVTIEGANLQGGAPIDINGDGAGSDGLVLGATSDGSTIENLEIRDFSGGGTSGVRIESSDNTFGPGNVIRNNTGGVTVEAADNRITENSIFDNGDRGVTLSGITAAVVPQIDEASHSAGVTALDIALTGPGGPAIDVVLEVFTNAACDESGFGEGRDFVASSQVSLESESQSFSLDYESLEVGDFVTVTATRLDPDGTSEFSNCVTVESAGGGGPFVVNSNDDVDDGSCSEGHCSLREAIDAANGNPNGTDPDEITFDLTVGPGAVITLAATLPPISDAVLIDGANVQGGNVTLAGPSLDEADGLVLAAGSGGSTIRSLEIHSFDQVGIRVQSAQNLIAASELHGVGTGVLIQNAGATDNVIGGPYQTDGNLMWNYTNYGVLLDSAGAGNRLSGNTIGLDSGNVSAGAAGSVRVNGTSGTLVGALTTGDDEPPNSVPGPDDLYLLDPNLGNVLSGNEIGSGVVIDGGSSGTVVAGNLIGVDRNGTDRGNANKGVLVSTSPNNQIGPGNRVAYNGDLDTGVQIEGAASTGNRVPANSIHDNQGLGINLVSGANNDLSAAVLDVATTGSIEGSINAVPERDYYLELFANDSCESAEGETFVGYVIVQDGSFVRSVTLPEGSSITATLTDSVTNDTSEFSNCVEVGGGGEVDPPVLTGAVPDAAGPPGSRLGVAGVWDSAVELAGQTFNVSFFSGNTCTEAGMTNPLGSRSELETNAGGIGAFAIDGLTNVSVGTLVAARVDGSEISNCVVADRNNVSWPTALELTAPATDSQNFLRSSGQGRWFKVPVVANSRLDVRVSGLPADYDLVVFKDIQAKYDELVSGAAEQPNLAVDDLNRQGAETPVDLFNTSQYNPSSWDPTNWDPTLNADVFSPQYSPTEYSPTEYSAAFTSPTEYSPTEYSPTEYSPTEYSPTEYSPTEYSDTQYSQDEWAQFTPADPRVFSAAQTASLVAVSAGVGTGDESVSVNTWNNTGHFYIRIQGKNGSFDADSPFSLQVSTQSSLCSGVVDTPVNVPTVIPPNLKTLILTSSGRGLDVAALSSRLSQLASHTAVTPAAVVDVSGPLAGLNLQADQNPGCPYAKNLVAAGIKDIVDAYRDESPALQYIVVVGGDDVIPFYRYPDPALLGNENLYRPPVGDGTASQASLRLGYVLSDDFLASSTSVSLHGNDFPVADIAIGRLVETQSDIAGMLDSFLASGGSSLSPTTTLTTGYDFLADAATDIKTTLATRVGGAASNHETLITNRGVSPGAVGTPPTGSWTALDLRRELLTERNDIVFLAGHFSANDALAADYRTNVLTTELASAPTGNFEKAIVFSAGCHAGYNIVNGHAVPGVTQILDWAQAFAQKKATLIAGTGYQYGDTDFLAHSERIYAELARQLGGPVGSSLLRSKQLFLEESPGLSALDEKALLQTTLFGLPMLSVTLTQPSLPGGAPVAPEPVGTGPGAAFDLEVENDFPVSTATGTLQSQALNGLGGSATWFEGTGGKVAVKPMQPVLPLQSVNVTASGRSLRGVLFTEGDYTDTTGTVPLTAAPATELRGIHAPFLTDVFFPPQPWTPNYFGALSGSGSTRLHVTPVQHRSESPQMTRRKFSGNMKFRLFYTGQIPVGPGLSAPPTITGVDASHAGNLLTFSAHVVGAPDAGIQEVWVTYTNPPEGSGNGHWESILLTQDEDDPTLWTGALTTTTPAVYHFMAQAVSGVGRVTIDNNLGAFYRYGSIPGPPDPDAEPPAGTSLAFQSAPPSPVRYGASFDVTVDLDGSASCVDGKRVRVDLGGVSLPATTNASGTATIEMRATVAPGIYPITATFAGDANCGPSDAVSTVQVLQQTTSLAIALPFVTLTASTTPQPTPLHDRTIVVTVSQGATVKFVHVGRTDPQGRVQIPQSLLATLTQGAYTVVAEYGGEVGYAASTATGGTLNVIRRGSGSDRITGTAGDDLIIDTGGSNTIDGRGGNDVILVSGSGSDKITGGDGDDIIDAGDGSNVVNGGAGNDTITTGSGSDSIDGGSGNDVINAGNGSNKVDAGTGDDMIRTGSGSDSIDGGAGLDYYNAGGGSNSVKNCEGTLP
jgi:CSLREA domain-containing protein